MSAILSGERVLTELDFARLSRLDDGRLPDDRRSPAWPLPT